MIDYQLPKTAGLAGSEGLPNLLLQQAECLADFEEILVFMSLPVSIMRVQMNTEEQKLIDVKGRWHVEKMVDFWALVHNG